MNFTIVMAHFSISTEEAVRLKFENRLDDTVKQKLAQSLASEILENDLLELQTNERRYGNYEIVFEGTLLVGI